MVMNSENDDAATSASGDISSQKIHLFPYYISVLRAPKVSSLSRKGIQARNSPHDKQKRRGSSTNYVS